MVSMRAVLLAAAAILAPGAAEAGDPAAGRQKAEMCVNCHGLDGVSLLPHAPNLSGQIEVYFVEQMKAFRSGKRISENMNVVARGLTDDDIADLAAWYGGIQVEITVPE